MNKEGVSKICKVVDTSIRMKACALVGRAMKKCADYLNVEKVCSLRDLPRRGFWSMFGRMRKWPWMNWQVRAAVLLSYLKIVESSLSKLPRKETKQYRKKYETIIHPVFCTRMEYCQVIRGYLPRDKFFFPEMPNISRRMKRCAAVNWFMEYILMGSRTILTIKFGVGIASTICAISAPLAP